MGFHRELTLLLAALLILPPLAAQQFSGPMLRAPNARSRAAQVGDSLAQLRQGRLRPLVTVDTSLGGVTWIQVDGNGITTAHARTPEAAADSFLARYRSSLLGLHSELGSVELLRSTSDGRLSHHRFAQIHSGYRVLYAQFIVHVAQRRGGYAAESANGFLFPDIPALPPPSLGLEGARNAALSTMTRAGAQPIVDSAPVIVAHDNSYVLTYLIPVFDTGRGQSFKRFVNAVSGEVFAEESAEDRFTSPTDLRGAPAARRNASKTHSPSESVGRSRVTGFVTASGLDWWNESQTFKVYDTGTNYQLRDNSHAGVSEIKIYDFADAPFSGGSCDGQSIVIVDSLVWGNKEGVSAVHHLGEAVTYFKDTFGRNGMTNATPELHACINAGTDSFYNARHAAYKLTFTNDAVVDEPSSAAQHVVTHEFTHGVTYHEVNFANTLPTRAVNEALADYFGARHEGTVCVGYRISGGRECIRALHQDSTYCEGGPNADHCYGRTLSSALWATSQANSGAYGTATDAWVYSAMVNYMTSLFNKNAAAHAIVTVALIGAHNGAVAAAEELQNQLNDHSLPGYGPYAVIMTGTSAWSVEIEGSSHVCGNVVFEIGSNGLGPDGVSVAFPDSQIDFGFQCTFSPPLAFSDSELNYHSCYDGHTHGFSYTTDDGNGPLTYYGAQSGCPGSVRAGPSTGNTIPTRFAVRQVVEPSAASLSGTFGTQSNQPLSLQVQQFGISALEIDLPSGTATAPIIVTVYNPQGRVVNRFSTAALGPGTQRVAWDRRVSGGRHAPPGVYVVVVQHGNYRHRTHFIIPSAR